MEDAEQREEARLQRVLNRKSFASSGRISYNKPDETNPKEYEKQNVVNAEQLKEEAIRREQQRIREQKGVAAHIYFHPYFIIDAEAEELQKKFLYESTKRREEDKRGLTPYEIEVGV